jgi:G3E family GTPase
LLAKEKPDVLLIEPTGLGHPRKVLQTLQSEHYLDVLTAGANVCLVDPRQLSDPRYTDNDTFHDQIALADILIANKTYVLTMIYDVLINSCRRPSQLNWRLSVLNTGILILNYFHCRRIANVWR